MGCLYGCEEVLKNQACVVHCSHAPLSFPCPQSFLFIFIRRIIEPNPHLCSTADGCFSSVTHCTETSSRFPREIVACVESAIKWMSLAEKFRLLETPVSMKVHSQYFALENVETP